MRLLFFILVLVLQEPVFCQDLNGIWRGSLTQEAGGCFPVYNLEIQVISTGTDIEGYAFDYYDKKRFVKHHFKGTYNAAHKKMIIREDQLLEVQIPHDCVVCTKTYELSFAKAADRDALTGTWTGIEADSKRVCPAGKITLYRESQPDFPTPFTDSAQQVNHKGLLKMKQRSTEIVQTLVLDSPTVKIDLYDNAEIDNDTVTIYLNNELLLYQQRLTNHALSISIKAVAGQEYELVMYADNLGSIPPNTALMTVSSGRDKFEVRLSASDKKNAAVRFRVRKKDN
ncbi:hypothetical protein [Flavihumibacter sp. CACIAM 22H1]|uniref:hypothetical protein n=1 Tax=Flavihumibacter sp. CACIAM 22H1 TaxID=1812911 RepID=UPI0007A7D64C|nr:hypothetical protein [Flavihumibacter sp. CACIAM 22H1]KYP14843.1 MAG: hypothetical protein A1D16_03970 [Flavihumibacter sp. CACIAM 22H1]